MLQYDKNLIRIRNNTRTWTYFFFTGAIGAVLLICLWSLFNYDIGSGATIGALGLIGASIMMKNAVYTEIIFDINLREVTSVEIPLFGSTRKTNWIAEFSKLRAIKQRVILDEQLSREPFLGRRRRHYSVHIQIDMMDERVLDSYMDPVGMDEAKEIAKKIGFDFFSLNGPEDLMFATPRWKMTPKRFE